jgi:hypothetical protein
MQQPQITKATRTRIRLKHSLAADQEINSVLPDALDEFEAVLARGDLKELKALATSSGTPDAAARSANLERVASTENIAICLGCALRRAVGDLIEALRVASVMMFRKRPRAPA